MRASSSTRISRVRKARKALAIAVMLAATPLAPAIAQQSFSSVRIEGNQRVDEATILGYLGLPKGTPVSAGALNDAYQRISNSGLFQSVELVPSGGTLVIRVTEYPTVNRINFEGNRKLKDEDLAKIIGSKSRRVFSPAMVEADAAKISEAYAAAGRMAARVTPKAIKRDNNTVDVVYEIAEGRVTEVERLSFTGNTAFSDRRLRQVLETKQAGFLRAIIQRDTFVPERLEFDKQVLQDFYRSRGYIDATVTGVASEMTRERDGFLITFNVNEGQKWAFRDTTVVSEIEGVDAAPYLGTLKIRKGVLYSPSAIDMAIARMEEIALRQGQNFVTIEPRITRNPRDLTLDVTFALVRGQRVFVERIDIEGNATTLDQVIRRQFKTVEGDPLNPREIRQAAERIRALDYFANADVNARPGTTPESVIVDVNVEEKPTGALQAGISYGVSAGVGYNLSFSESNFLGRGQYLSVNATSASKTKNAAFTFIEPAFLGRDLKFKLSGWYDSSNNNFAKYQTERIGFSPAIDFPVSQFGRLELRYTIGQDRLFNYTGAAGAVLNPEMGTVRRSGLGYTYSYDTRAGGFDPKAGVLLRFSQDFFGLGGDFKAVKTEALVSAETRVMNEDVTLRFEAEGGLLHMLDGTSRVTDRFFANGKIRGFEPNGIGPRLPTAKGGEALGGNAFFAVRLESEFPLGLPEEYKIHGGAFVDAGSVWSLNNTGGVDDGAKLRAAAGLSLFWDTPLGPLRFNFSRPLKKEAYDNEQNFDLTVSTRF